MSRPYSGKEDVSITDKEKKEFDCAYKKTRNLKKTLMKRSQLGDSEADYLLKSKFGVTIHRVTKTSKN